MNEEYPVSGHQYIDPFWSLTDSLSVVQAAALIAGYEPNHIGFNFNGGVLF